MGLFIIAAFSPYLLVSAASLWGAPWGWLAVGYITVLVFVLDRWMAVKLDNADPEAEFPGATPLLMRLGGMHFVTLGLVFQALGSESQLTGLETTLMAISAALAFGQISHPVAHELIHKPGRMHRLLGQFIYTSILFGHHASAHLRVHHVHVGSKADPNSARWGEGIYRFLARCWVGSFREGLRAENKLRRNRQGFDRSHPYLIYCGGAAGLLIMAFAIGGLRGLGIYVFIALYAQLQILLSDYVQHYGLRRATHADGSLEPVGPHHSWNAPHWASSAMTLNAPRHSDHHVAPSRAYPALQFEGQSMPRLPYALPVMAVLAVVPPLWRRIMDPRCAEWAERRMPPKP